jgi:hypothetical protein
MRAKLLEIAIERLETAAAMLQRAESPVPDIVLGAIEHEVRNALPALKNAVLCEEERAEGGPLCA